MRVTVKNNVSDFLIFPGWMFIDAQIVLPFDFLGNFFERNSALPFEPLIFFFIPDDHTRNILHCNYNVNEDETSMQHPVLRK